LFAVKEESSESTSQEDIIGGETNMKVGKEKRISLKQESTKTGERDFYNR